SGRGKDASAGRPPGSRLERLRRAFPSRPASVAFGAKPRRLQLREQPQLELRSLFGPLGAAPAAHLRFARRRLQARIEPRRPASRRERDAVCDNARRLKTPRRIALIKYRVRIADLDRHLFEIDCRIDDPTPEQRFTLPAWI